MIGIVVVSHSRTLGYAALALAEEMVPEEARPRVAVAAGLDETSFGTDAAAIADAITEVDSPDGVLILMDLGSALLSAEMALEFVEPDLAARVRLSPAPLVEGLVSALVTAGTGASLDEVANEAAEALLPKAEHLGTDTASMPLSAPPPPPAPPADSGPGLVFTHTVRNPHGLHARPAAALVSRLRGLNAGVRLRNVTTGAGPADARSMGKVASLGLRPGQVLEAVVSGPDAAAALTRLRDLAATDFGETAVVAAVPVAAAPVPMGTGRQVVVAPALVRATEVDCRDYRAGDPAEERARLDAAVAAVAGRLESLGRGGHADIFEAQAALLADPELIDGLAADVAAGLPATIAVQRRTADLATVFAALDDPYLRDRAEDVRSLETMVLEVLVATGPAPAPATAGPHVLIVAELDAATAARLGPDTLAVVTTRGGATGHGVIVAASQGIPVLPGRSEAVGIPDGTLLAVDAAGHRLWVAPSESELTQIRALAAAREAESAEAAAAAHDPARTPGGRTVLVEANIASLADARAAAAAGADGSGLVRTELLFGDRAVAPSAEEQAAVFVEIGRLLAAPTTVRTWDPGGDKPLAFLPQEAETNPMLGERGIRAMRTRPDLFRTQLRAVALAAREVPVRVMFPMVTEPDEVIWAKAELAAVTAEIGEVSLPVGMMVEVPAAAVRASDFVGLVDFVSIGTNDLTQYTTATDRGNGTVAHLARADSAAVLQLIGGVGRAFAGHPVAVCGDLASDPDVTATLVDLGVTELSVRPPLVGLVKQAVRRGGAGAANGDLSPG